MIEYVPAVRVRQLRSLVATGFTRPALHTRTDDETGENECAMLLEARVEDLEPFEHTL
jgi:hypothetical protein